MRSSLFRFFLESVDSPNEMALDEPNGIQEIEFTSGYIAVKLVSKVQQDCLSMFRVNTPSDRYDNNLAFSNRLKKALKPH